MSTPQDRLLAPRLRPLVQVVGFVRKELFDIIRQPRLLAVLVGGPFLILTLFAAGYDQQSVVLRTVFVGPEGSVYEDAIDRYEEELSFYIDNAGYTSDVVEARDRLRAGDVDLAVVFPADPVATILGGEQAVISILHDKIDPLQQTAVEVSAQVAVLELNATVLEEIFAAGQAEAGTVQDEVGTIDALVADLADAASGTDAGRVGEIRTDLGVSVDGIGRGLELTELAVAELDGEVSDEDAAALEDLRSAIDDLDASLEDLDGADSDAEIERAVAEVERRAQDLGPLADGVLSIDPRVAIRPFASDSESLLRAPVGVVDFFVPSSLGLLLQHLAITFAALALVRDSSLGLFESFRVGPVAARHVLTGKYAAYLVIGGFVAAVLIALVVGVVGVPMRGSYAWLAGGVLLLLAASIGLGLVLSAVSQSSSQAVQYAMLTLLAGMFFGGFLLTLDAFRMPFRLVPYVLPVTYAIGWFQDVMLRGDVPDTVDVVGLGVTTLVYGAIAGWLFSRRLRIR